MKKIQNEDNLRTVVSGKTNGVQISELLKKKTFVTRYSDAAREFTWADRVIQKSTHSKLEALLF